MGRWRPPASAASPYITPAGYRRLQAETKALWTRRNEVVKHLAAAAAEGDRSENAEYIYRKKELREIDRRIAYLQKRLPALKIVSQAPPDAQSVFFGAWVELENSDGQSIRYRLVGADETDSDKGHISIDSALARALLKRSIDDEIVVRTPQGEVTYLIVDVRYAAGEAGTEED
jgi:transcription elongation factor GreB